LQLRTGVAYTTLHKLAHDEHAAKYATAQKISDGTDGRVTITELCELPRGKSRKSSSKRRSTQARSKSRKRAAAASTSTPYALPKLAAARP
jgi:hypothetical protein